MGDGHEMTYTELCQWVVQCPNLMHLGVLDVVIKIPHGSGSMAECSRVLAEKGGWPRHLRTLELSYFYLDRGDSDALRDLWALCKAWVTHLDIRPRGNGLNERLDGVKMLGSQLKGVSIYTTRADGLEPSRFAIHEWAKNIETLELMPPKGFSFDSHSYLVLKKLIISAHNDQRHAFLRNVVSMVQDNRVPLLSEFVMEGNNNIGMPTYTNRDWEKLVKAVKRLFYEVKEVNYQKTDRDTRRMGRFAIYSHWDAYILSCSNRRN